MKKIFLSFLVLIPFLNSCDDFLEQFEKSDEETVVPFEVGEKPIIQIVSYDQYYFEIRWNEFDDLDTYKYSWDIKNEFGEIITGVSGSIEEPFLKEENHYGCGRTINIKVRAGRSTADEWFYSEYDEVTIEIPPCEYNLVDVGISSDNICETGSVFFDYAFYNTTYDIMYDEPVEPYTMSFDIQINDIDPEYVYEENLEFVNGLLYWLPITTSYVCDSDINTGSIVVTIYATKNKSNEQFEGSPLVYTITIN